ncbi:MAG: outer membrane protein assembly factor BamD [Gammaproteobacteria bacterium]|nr:outer membrane protein assembly factor BamD [Gammaproteobacteria bacterium]
MKKIILLLLLCSVALLSACSSNELHDSFSAYRNQTAAQLYNSSKSELIKGHPNQAIKKLEALNALYPFGAYAEQGLVNLIYAYYENDNADEALATADRYLNIYPRGAYSDYVYYMKGVIAFKQGFTWLQRKWGVNRAHRDLSNLKTAYLSFNELVTNFPTSPYVPDALARMRYIRNLFAEKELDVAQFYFDRKAYVAAANRASEIVVHYDRSPYVIPALSIMVKSYRKLGMTEMADNTMKIFQASYPNSPKYRHLLR